MSESLRSSELKVLKARAQLLQPALKIGKAGVTEAFLASLNQCLDRSGLVKIKFDEFKDRKKILVPEIAAKTGTQVILFVGNTATLYRSTFSSKEPSEE